jgi:polyhydroxybutyrate depolymerase
MVEQSGSARAGGERRDHTVLRWMLATFVAAVVSFVALAVVLQGGADPTAAVARVAQRCDPARTPTADSGRVVNGSVSSGDSLRTYRLTLPATYDGTRPVPLVILLHGTSGTIDDIESYTGMPLAAGQRGYAVLTPQGLAPADGTLPIHWTVPGFDGPGSPDDVAFVSGLVDTVTTAYCVDASRVFATGISGGAAFATLLACRTDLLAGIAPVAGFNLVPPCENARPLTVLAFHGTGDALVAYSGIEVPSADPTSADDSTQTQEAAPLVDQTQPSSEATPRPAEPSPSTAADRAALGSPFYNGPVVDDIARWAAAFGCSAETGSQPSVDVSSKTYTSCRDEVTVALWTVANGGHVWPGAATVPENLGYQTDSVSATSVMLDAFDAAPSRGTTVVRPNA